MALNSWAGELHAEVTDAARVIAEIARLSELRIAAIELLASAELAVGHASSVIGRLEQVVREHPTREGATAILATALHRAGRQADALEALRSNRIHLSVELGLEPGPTSRKLERDTLSDAAHLDADELQSAASPQAPIEPPALAESTSTRGRSAELTAIADAAQAARSGGCEVVWVGGEAGAGKTSLPIAAAAGLRTAGWTVAAGRCPEVDGAPPAWAWTEVLRHFSDSFAATDPRRLRALAPLRHTDESITDDGQSPFWTARAIADLIDRSATNQPAGRGDPG
ncbi:hypothetical protein MSAR_47530 [Mycolicibacterium sarraceniae]|uniref:Bacterial transcriptional activator domain-containing protein n=1 Tax=Mycolicibacterium sarraceniae TaxID=1534348 RepID=A0A7I7SX81_9MYCO|nr:hypothetical protein MSAR_47530 [Mycolicibacterium sarraceniae]